MRLTRRPPSLSLWLGVAFSAMSIVLTLALCALIERRSIEEIKQSIGHGLGELAMQTSDKLELGMFERYREVGLMARRSDLDSSMPNAHRRAALDEMRSSLGYYSWIGLAGLDGKVQVAAGGMLEGADVSQRPWFSGALEGRHVGDVHEAKLLASLLPRQSEPWRFVDIAFPRVDAKGEVRGVLGAHLSWDWAKDVQRSVMAGVEKRRRVEILIVDASGRVILGPGDVAGRALNLPSLRLAKTNQRWGYTLEQWPDGRSYLVGFARGRGHGSYPGLGWTVLSRQDE